MNLSQNALLKLEEKVSGVLRTFGDTLFQEWQVIQEVSFKEHGEPVTKFDLIMETAIRNELAKLLPDAGFIVEEGESSEAAELNWIIDPIDQTKNFISRIPLFYTQIALVDKGSPVLGVVYNPVSGQLFSASSGNGTKLNNIPLTRKVEHTLRESIVDIDFGNSDEISWKIPVLDKLARAAYRIRMTGGAFAPYLITGGIDAFVVLPQRTKIVDWMPRMILAREAGLLFEQVQFKNYKVVIMGNKTVFEEIKAIISKC